MSTTNPRAALELRLSLSPALSDEVLGALFAAAWTDFEARSFREVLRRSAFWVAAHAGERLVGFVNVAWDGGVHGFLLDTTVHPDVRRRGVGLALVRLAVDAARERGLEWLHVDHEPHLTQFYRRAGFRPTAAGLIRLQAAATEAAGVPAPAALSIRRYEPRFAEACSALMEGLAAWFPFADARAAYVADLPRLPSWVLARGAEASPEVLAFATLTRPAPQAFELHVLAVAREHQRRGLGRLLLAHVERFARAQGSKLMHVKTLGPSHPDPLFAATRAFYVALGYVPLFESDRLWGGADNPALVLVKPLA